MLFVKQMGMFLEGRQLEGRIVFVCKEEVDGWIVEGGGVYYIVERSIVHYSIYRIIQTSNQQIAQLTII